MSSDQSLLAELLDYVQGDGRICPVAGRWNELWQLLPNRTRRGGGWDPPAPLILAASGAPPLFKTMRLREHIEYAAAHGVLDEVDEFLRSLTASEWVRVGD